MNKLRTILSRIFSRLTLTILFMLLQLFAIYLAIRLLGEQVSFFYGFSRFAAMLLCLRIIYRNDEAAYKIAWLIPVLAAPLFGGLLYLVFGQSHLSAREQKRMQSVLEDYRLAMDRARDSSAELAERYPEQLPQSSYIRSAANTPPFRATETAYLPIGEVFFSRLMEELGKAENFILLEFYIIRPGKMWDELHALLREKAAQGVKVKLMYDFFGVMFKLPDNTKELLESEGIEVCVFNPIRPVLSLRFNNRDHRKICVIDGKVGFLGGVNISDEYINVYPRCGHWLDSGVCLRGEAVSALSAMFLSLWNFASDHPADPEAFLAGTSAAEDDGFVQPYTDMPLDDEAVGENVYLNMIQRARDYVYINSPYLVLDSAMLSSLCAAAKSGVDVRIVAPGVCDSRLMQELNRSYYEPLSLSGVKVYEYTPGMVHAKTFVSDDMTAVVGSINLDYRSLFLHYESAVWLCGSKAVGELKEAYLEELEQCRLMTTEEMTHMSRSRHLLWALLRSLAPLL